MNVILQFMKRNYKVLLVIAALSVALWSFIPREKESDPEKDKLPPASPRLKTDFLLDLQPQLS